MIPSCLAAMLLAVAASAVAPTAAAPPAERWVPIGPDVIRDGTGGTSVGRVTALAVDATNPRHWLAGAAAGGVWRTTDAGATWTPLTDAQASLAVGAVAVAPARPGVFYAGTGDRAGSVGTYAGAGLLKSTDAGVTWTLLATRTFAGAAFSALAVDPRDPDVLVATTERGAAGLDPELRPLHVPPRGIFKSTDGGVTWAAKGPSDAEHNDATDLAVDPTDFERMFAAVGSRPPGPTNGLYRSSDAGETWSEVPGPWTHARGGAGRMVLALAPSNPRVLYVAVANATTLGLLGLWKTNDAWAPAPAFTRVPTEATDETLPGYGFCGNRCWFALRLTVDPRQADVLWAGGVRPWKCSSCGLEPEWWAAPAGVHVDQHAFAWAGPRLLVGNDGGVWSTPDGGASWAEHNTGLAITQFWSGCLHPRRADVALAGSQDNGAPRWSGTGEWSFSGVSGDGGACAFSSRHPDTHWQDGLLRTRDGAAAPWHDASRGIDWTEPKVFVTPLAKCPANDDVLLAGLSSVWRTRDFFSAAAPTWTANGGPWGEPLAALAFAGSEADCFTYAAGSRSGRLHLTTDGGANWTDLDPAGVLPEGYVSALAFDPADADVLYVALARFADRHGGNLWRTRNARSPLPAWRAVGPPAELPLNSVAVDPSRPGTLYAGSDDGLWVTDDGGRQWAWHGPAHGLPRVPVYDVQVNPETRRVVAFTHGRGAFKLLRADLALRLLSDRSGPALTFVATNHGPDAADDVTVEIALPPGATAGALKIERGRCTAQRHAARCRLARLDVGEQVTLSAQVHVPGGAGVVTARVSSAAVDPRPADNVTAWPLSVD